MSDENLQQYYIVKAKNKNAYFKLGMHVGNKDYNDFVIKVVEKYKYQEEKIQQLKDFFIWQLEDETQKHIPDTIRNTIDGASAVLDKDGFNDFLEKAKKYLNLYKDFLTFIKKVSETTEYKNGLDKNYKSNFSDKSLESQIEVHLNLQFKHHFPSLNPLLRTIVKNGFDYLYVDKLGSQFSDSGYVIYQKDIYKETEGYLDPQKSIGSLNKAKIFPNEGLARKFASQRTGQFSDDTALVQVSVQFVSIGKHSFKQVPNVLKNAESIVEKSKLLENQNQQMEDKIKKYEIILEENGLLDKVNKKPKIL